MMIDRKWTGTLVEAIAEITRLRGALELACSVDTPGTQEREELARLREENIRLRERVRELEADGEAYRWGVENARWIRHEHEAYVAIPVAVDANLSCVAFRRAAIDRARGKA